MDIRKTEIENSLARAVEAQTPNVLPDVFLRIQAQEQGDVPPEAAQPDSPNTVDFAAISPPAKRPRRALRWVVSVAAVLLLLVGLYGGVRYTNGLDAIVSFDVNPSVQLQVNRAEKVIAAAALNPEANEILDGMNLTGVDLNVAVNALVGSMLKHGYISASKNTILISVENQNAQKGAALQEKLANEVGSILNSNAVEAAVLSQTLPDDDSLRALAQQYGISLGKAALVQLLVQQNPQLDFAGIAALPVNDIYLLLSSKHTSLDGLASSGQASTTGYIGEDEAKAVALAYAGLMASETRYIQAELDYEDGRMVYEVELATDTTEYEYTIDALNGTPLEQDIEPLNRPEATPPAQTPESTPPDASAGDAPTPPAEPQSPPPASTPAVADAYIGTEQAQAIAAQHAGVVAADMWDYKIKLEEDDGRMVYDLEFKHGGAKYDYEIDATTGAILDWDMDAKASNDDDNGDDDYDDNDDDDDNDEDNDDDDHDD